MLEIKIEKSFKKDILRDQKYGKYTKSDFDILKIIINKLQSSEKIDSLYQRHPLKGDMKELESLHVKNDWLLIFKVDADFLYLVMLGTHSQVYKKFK